MAAWGVTVSQHSPAPPPPPRALPAPAPYLAPMAARAVTAAPNTAGLSSGSRACSSPISALAKLGGSRAPASSREAMRPARGAGVGWGGGGDAGRVGSILHHESKLIISEQPGRSQAAARPQPGHSQATARPRPPTREVPQGQALQARALHLVQQ